MTIVENADLKLTLTIYADEEADLLVLINETVKQIKRGSVAGSVGGCMGVCYYDLEKQSRSAELRNGADRAGAGESPKSLRTEDK